MLKLSSDEYKKEFLKTCTKVGKLQAENDRLNKRVAEYDEAIEQAKQETREACVIKIEQYRLKKSNELTPYANSVIETVDDVLNEVVDILEAGKDK